MKSISDKEHKSIILLALLISAVVVVVLTHNYYIHFSCYSNYLSIAERGLSLNIDCGPRQALTLPQFFIFLNIPLIYKAKTMICSFILTTITFAFQTLTFLNTRIVEFNFFEAASFGIFALTSILFFWQLSIIFRFIFKYFQPKVSLK